MSARQASLLPPPRQAIEAATATDRAARQHWNQGQAHLRKGDFGRAVQAFSQAVQAAPGDLLYRLNLGNAHRHAGNFEPAGAALRRVLELEPQHALALRLLADCLGQQHRYAEALALHEQLQRNGVREVDAMVQHGAMLQALRRPVEAIDILMQAAAIKPGLAQTHAVMSTSFRDMALQTEAIECLKTVLALSPGNLQAMSQLSYEKRHLCDWDSLDEDVRALTQNLATAPAGLARPATVFGMLSLPLAPELLLVAARGEALACGLGVVELPSVQAAQRTEVRTRLALLSYDFYEHPVSQLMVEVLEQLSRQRFELVLYSSGRDDGSHLRQRVINAASSFVDIRGMSDRAAAARVRADGIDVLIDLQGHTRGQRLAIFAARPAPVQAAFLGFPGSTGAPYIDYLIGDPFVTPLDLAPLYSEKLAQMPLCFQPNGRWRPLPQPMSRAAAGLPDEAFVLCAFNHTYKILPAAFDVWCQLLRDVPHAVLWLKETNGQLHANVLREAALRGVAAERIVFAKNVSYADHFSRLALADVFADTWPYNAHTTASDALWAGVPVVTLYGNSFASRVAGSVLNAAGLAELAFESVADYGNAITALALQPELLAGYRRHLQEQRMTLPLFDTAAYVRQFEALILRMHARWQAGLPPEHLAAAELPSAP